VDASQFIIRSIFAFLNATLSNILNRINCKCNQVLKTDKPFFLSSSLPFFFLLALLLFFFIAAILLSVKRRFVFHLSFPFLFHVAEIEVVGTLLAGMGIFDCGKWMVVKHNQFCNFVASVRKIK
jgi:hypothetical protein